MNIFWETMKESFILGKTESETDLSWAVEDFQSLENWIFSLMTAQHVLDQIFLDPETIWFL